jgi:hypothetical protein
VCRAPLAKLIVLVHSCRGHAPRAWQGATTNALRHVVRRRERWCVCALLSCSVSHHRSVTEWVTPWQPPAGMSMLVGSRPRDSDITALHDETNPENHLASAH